ncbi:MAG: FUSC family protein [Verrucomicrobiota bacterium]
MVGTVVAAMSYKFFDLPGAPWVAAVSAVLVTQPNLHSSLKASMLRVTANVAGAFGGAVLLAITRQPIAAMAIGVMLTGLICYLLNQDDAQRPAFVAVIIVTLFAENSGWHNSFHRVCGVIIGCACALVVGFLFDKLSPNGKLSGRNKNQPDD